MTFVHPLLLGGLALIGIPVLIHLMMRQKPKRLPFPAFRFLLQKHRTNQTRLRLRHLLLLLLRMAVIAFLCLALVRPAITNGLLPPISPGRPVSAVLLIDTSYSMEYAVGGKSRLDEAKRRAGELLDELPDGSKVAVLDSADVGGDPLVSLSDARKRIESLKLRHANAPLTRQLERAYALFPELDRLQDNPAEAPKVLYLFSDRTHGCWDQGAAQSLRQPPGISVVFVDVGVEKPADLAITGIKVEPAIIRPGNMVRINVAVQATGADYEAQLNCIIDLGTPSEVPVRQQSKTVAAGRTEIVTFEYQAAAPSSSGEKSDGLAIGWHQADVRLSNHDALAFDDAAYATFRIIGGRPLLVLTDEKTAAGAWAEKVAATFIPEVVTLAEAEKKRPELDKYAVVCLFNAAHPPDWLWRQLKQYVVDGHGLFVVLGGNKGGPDPEKGYADETAKELLPGTLEGIGTLKDKEQFWGEFQGDGGQRKAHPLIAPFLADKSSGNVIYFINEYLKPQANRFWKVTPNGGDVLTHFADANKSPALLERTIDHGKVLMLTTALDPQTTWNNYNGPFGFVLSNRVLVYLAGHNREGGANYISGQTVVVPLSSKHLTTYTLTGPGLMEATDATLSCLEDQRELRITRATTPGNFRVLALPEGQGPPQTVTAFSINPRPDEHDLERVPVEQIESLLGEGSVLPIGRTTSLRERLDARWPQPFDLVPWLLIALLLFLVVESLLANRFYRRPPEEKQDASLPLAA